MMKAATIEKMTIVEMTMAALASPRKYDTTARVSNRPLSLTAARPNVKISL
jgi:hypothetical protein